jgi:hypothetical protein
MNHTSANRACKHFAKAVALGLAVAAMLATGAQAGGARKGNLVVRAVYLVKSGSGSQVRYNKNPGKKVINVSASEYIKSNPYVCTPSGFGQKARCYVRGLSL